MMPIAVQYPLNAKAIEKRSVEGTAQPAPVLRTIHVDGRLDSPLIGCPRRGRIE
jgi:hypothetical protein